MKNIDLYASLETNNGTKKILGSRKYGEVVPLYRVEDVYKRQVLAGANNGPYRTVNLSNEQ